MSAMTMSVTQTTRSEIGLERVTFWFLLGFVAALQMSIAAANVLLALTFVCWVAMQVRDRTLPSAPRFFMPLAIYAAATLVSSMFSFDARESFIDDKQLLLFAIVPMVYDIGRGQRAATVIDVLVSIGAASAAYGIIQYGVLHYDNLGRRPEGALTHYMTYSGILMLVVCAAVARLLYGGRDRVWPALVMPALLVALALTLTRSAWVGTAVAVGVLFLFKDFRLIGLAPIAVAGLLFFAPTSVTQRMTSTFSKNDPTSQDRVAMLEIGARVTRDFPLAGVGPNMIPRVYPRYRPDYAVNRVNPHLHNVPVQIMAERGIPALVIWLAFIGVTLAGLLKVFRDGERLLGATGIAAVAAMLAAGMFEYNFGDSEFLMTFLVLITLPYAAIRDSQPRAAATAQR
ncbi:MAG TPA: O-antigen ligase family protein [Vicinamibacterales bacterium]|nr:O-antigen ligase family protein [Vicinamibacterales bacterium]